MPLRVSSMCGYLRYGAAETCKEHITHYTQDSLEKILRDNGFDILESRYGGRSELIIKARKASGA